MKTFSVFLVVVLCSGCEFSTSGSSSVLPVSMNVQRAVLHSGGQVATSALLDSSSIDKVDQRIADTKVIVNEIRQLLDTGKFGAMTLVELQSGLNKIVPAEYSIYSSQIVSAVSAFVTVPTDKLGENNILRIKEVLDGIELRCERYDKTARLSDRSLSAPAKTPKSAVRIVVQ